MLDVESTGVQILEDKILQIGLLELIPSEVGFIAGKRRKFMINTDKLPETKFQKKYLSELFEECQRSDLRDPKEIRARIINFFLDCGAFDPDQRIIVTWCGLLDLGLMIQHGYLKEGYYDKEDNWIPGDVSFQYSWDIEGIIWSKARQLRLKPSEVTKLYAPTEGMEHDALADCEYQLTLLNNLLLDRRVQQTSH